MEEVNQELMEEKLERRAIKEGWPITEEMKKAILEKTYARALCGIPDIEEHATKSMWRWTKGTKSCVRKNNVE